MPPTRFRALALAAGLLLAPSLASTQAAAIVLDFSGGSGSPLTMTLAEPVTYTIDVAPTAGLAFDFKNIANLFNGSVALSGTMKFTINGGSPIAIDVFTNGDTGGAVGSTDFLVWKNGGPSVALGDVLVLSPGPLSTLINIAAAAPASGPYSAILVDGNNTQIAVGTPEPTSLCLLALGAVCGFSRRRRAA